MKKVKVIVSLLCAVACIIATGFVPSAVTVSAVTYPETLTDIYPSDFGIVDGVYVTGTSGQYTGDNKTIVAGGEGTSTLIGTMFSMNFLYTGAPVWMFYGAPSTNQSVATTLKFGQEDTLPLQVTYNDANGQRVGSIGEVLNSEKAGVKFMDERYVLSISMQAVDSDSDGSEDDLKFGIYFNYNLYDGRYFYLANAAACVDNYISFHSDPEYPSLGYERARPHNMEISSPVNAVDPDAMVITPADFGISDGAANATAELNMNLDKKVFKAENFFKNPNESIDYAGIKLSQGENGTITLSDSTGNNSFESYAKEYAVNKAVDLSGFTPITISDFKKKSGISIFSQYTPLANGTYTANKNDLAFKNYIYYDADTLDGTYFVTKVKTSEGTYTTETDGAAKKSNAAIYLGNSWYGINTNFYDDYIAVRCGIASAEDSPWVTITATEAGLTTFKDTEFEYGISIVYTDTNNDGTKDYLEYGIFINGNLMCGDFFRMSTLTNTLGNYVSVYVNGATSAQLTAGGSNDNAATITLTAVADNEITKSDEVGLEEAFLPRDVEIATNVVDNDADTQKDDLKVDIYLDDEIFKTVYINDYNSKITNNLTVIGDVTSEPERFSYLSDVVGIDTLSSNAKGIKFSDEKVFSGNVTLTADSAKLSLGKVAGYVSSNHFAIEDGSYNKNATAYGALNDLNNAYFSAKVAMGLNTFIYYGSTGGADGIQIKQHMNKLRVYTDSSTYVDITTDNAGVDDFKTEFVLGLCAYITDTDNDGMKDDLRFGIWFNGVFNQYIDIKDKAATFGNGIFITSTGSNSLTISDHLASFGEADAAFAPESKMGEEVLAVSFEKNNGKFALGGIFDKVFDGIAADSTVAVDVAIKPVALEDAAFDDAKISVYLNGNFAAGKFVTDLFANLSVPSVAFESANATVTNRLPEDSITSDRLFDLNQGDYLLYGAHEIFINRQGGHEAGELLTVPGEYTIIRKFLGKEYVSKIHLYKAGYINADADINVLDFIVTKRLMAGLSDIPYQRKGADINFDGNIDSTDLLSVKRMVLDLEAAPEDSPADKYTFRENVMPIAGYFGPLLAYQLGIEDDIANEVEKYSFNTLTENVYRLISEAGINFINKIETRKDIQQATWAKTGHYADKYGIDIAYNIAFNNDYSDADWAKLLARYAHFESFQAAHVRDEPWAGLTVGFPKDSVTDHMDTYSAFATRTNKFANLMGYTNLLPYYNNLTGNEDNDALYQAYLDKYIADFAPKMISYDYYPFPSFGEDDYKRYYRNLRIVRDTAKANDMPFWTYIQVGAAEKGFYVGTEAEMRWNVNTSLAYGAKGIQYYTLIQTYGTAKWYKEDQPGVFNFNNAGVIAANGRPTQYYPYVKRINQQIMAVDEVLVNADFEKVLAVGLTAQLHTGEDATKYGSIKTINATDLTNGLVIGCFNYKGKEAYYIVNNSMEGENTATLTLDDTYSISAIAKDVNEVTTSNTYSVTLAAGDARLIVLN